MKGKEAATAARRRVAELEAELDAVRLAGKERLTVERAAHRAALEEAARGRAAEVTRLHAEIDAGTSDLVRSLREDNERLRAAAQEAKDELGEIQERWGRLIMRVRDHGTEDHGMTNAEGMDWVVKLLGGGHRVLDGPVTGSSLGRVALTSPGDSEAARRAFDLEVSRRTRHARGLGPL